MRRRLHQPPRVRRKLLGSPMTGRLASRNTQQGKCHGHVMASQTCKVYGATASSRHWSGRAPNAKRKLVKQKRGKPKILRTRQRSIFAWSPPSLPRAKKQRTLTTPSGHLVHGTKCPYQAYH